MKIISANNNKNEAKIKFQGQSARPHRWFDLDFDWIELNFSTREPYLCKKFFQSHDNTQDTSTLEIFQFPIGNSKYLESFKIHNDDPILKYCQKSLNSCCLKSLASDFASIE